MSLDRGRAPWVAAVNFGGRLRDTSIGLVSLLCDVRFKTFSAGLDLKEAIPLITSGAADHYQLTVREVADEDAEHDLAYGPHAT